MIQGSEQSYNICVKGINSIFLRFYYGSWNCSDRVVFCVIHFFI